jgi:hypothetical protein
LAVYKGTSLPLKNRLVAATAAISYETPRLPPAEHSGELKPHIATDKPVSPDEARRSAANKAAERPALALLAGGSPKQQSQTPKKGRRF